MGGCIQEGLLPLPSVIATWEKGVEAVADSLRRADDPGCPGHQPLAVLVGHPEEETLLHQLLRLLSDGGGVFFL